MDDDSPLLVERRHRVAVLTMNRPDVLNALNADLRRRLEEQLNRIGADDDIWAVVLTGGERAFCSGADLSSPPAAPTTMASQNQRLDDIGWVGRQTLLLLSVDKPVVAAVNGPAVGAGMSLALSCDLRVGGPGTRFKTVFAQRSLAPEGGISYLLERLIGYSKAADLLFTSREVDGPEAHRLGLLDRLAQSDSEILPQALELAEHITRLPPLAVRSARRALRYSQEADLRHALLYEKSLGALARSATHDVAEARASFRERREPNFTGS